MLTLVGIPVGWFASVVSALIVLTHFMRSDAPITLISGIGPPTTLYTAGGVLVIVAFTVFTRPLTVCAGWLVMAGLVAAAVTYLPSQQGFTQTVVVVEGITLVLAGFAAFVKVVSLLPERYVFALFLAKRIR